jgi:hypothetical protein
MVMLNRIPTVAAAEAFVNDKLAKKDKIMGFGHRVYKAYDPRATHLKVLAKQLAQDTGNMDLYDKSSAIEQVMATAVAAKGIYPNVDFYSATTYHCIGLPLTIFDADVRRRPHRRLVGPHHRAAVRQSPLPPRCRLQGTPRRGVHPHRSPLSPITHRASIDTHPNTTSRRPTLGRRRSF